MQSALRYSSCKGLRLSPCTPRQAYQHVCQPVAPPAAGAAAPSSRWQPCPQQHLQQQQRAVQAHAYQFKQGPDPADRVLAALPYLLPLLDALPYGEWRWGFAYGCAYHPCVLPAALAHQSQQHHKANCTTKRPVCMCLSHIHADPLPCCLYLNWQVATSSLITLLWPEPWHPSPLWLFCITASRLHRE